MGQKAALPGTVTVSSAGTRVACSASTLPVASVLIQADTSNTGYLYVGDNTVSSTKGISLSAGDAIEFSVSVNGRTDELDLADIYLDAQTSGNKGRITVLRRA